MDIEEEIAALVAEPEVAREIARSLLLDDTLPERLESFIEKVAAWPKEWAFSPPQAKFLIGVRNEQRLVDQVDGISAALLVNDVMGALSDGSHDSTFERVSRLEGRSFISMRDFGWLIKLSHRLDGRHDYAMPEMGEVDEAQAA